MTDPSIHIPPYLLKRANLTKSARILGLGILKKPFGSSFSFKKFRMYPESSFTSFKNYTFQSSPNMHCQDKILI